MATEECKSHLLNTSQLHLPRIYKFSTFFFKLNRLFHLELLSIESCYRSKFRQQGQEMNLACEELRTEDLAVMITLR